MNAVTWSVLAADWLRWAVGEVRGPRARNLLIIRLNRLYILDTCVSHVSPLPSPAWSRCPTQTRILRERGRERERLSLIITVFFFQPLRAGHSSLPAKVGQLRGSQAYNLMVGFHKHKPGNQPAVRSSEIPKQHLQIPD